MAKHETRYVCQQCGYTSLKWLGRCPGCGSWDSLVEELAVPEDRHRPSYLRTPEKAVPKTISQVDKVRISRLTTGIREFDRVLGGGIVPGSLILLGGAPGIGKSTITLDVSMKAAGRGLGRGVGSPDGHARRAPRESFGPAQSDDGHGTWHHPR